MTREINLYNLISQFGLSNMDKIRFAIGLLEKVALANKDKLLNKHIAELNICYIIIINV